MINPIESIDPNQTPNNPIPEYNSIQETPDNQTPEYNSIQEDNPISEEIKKKDCIYGEPTTELDKIIETKIEKYKDINRLINLNNKLKEYVKSIERYSQNIQYILEEPTKVELSEIQESLEKCNSDNKENHENQDQYYLSKYEKIGDLTLSEFIKKKPDILTIKDIHSQLLNTIKELYEKTKIVHYNIKNNNIIVKDTDEIPVITNFKSRGFLLTEITIDNFETILTEIDDYQCIEAHILVYLGKKKSEENWKTIIYDEQQNTEAIQTQTSNTEEYIGKTYAKVYDTIINTIKKWDIYSITKMILNILIELNDPLLQNYQNSLTEVLSKKTTELEYILPIISAEPISAEPISAEPTTDTPISAEPISAEPISAEPISAEPISAEPISDVPISDQTPSYQTPPYQTPPYQTPPYQTPSYQTPPYQTPPYQTPPYQPNY